jgi:hypothetical protein
VTVVRPPGPSQGCGTTRRRPTRCRRTDARPDVPRQLTDRSVDAYSGAVALAGRERRLEGRWAWVAASLRGEIAPRTTTTHVSRGVFRSFHTLRRNNDHSVSQPPNRRRLTCVVAVEPRKPPPEPRRPAHPSPTAVTPPPSAWAAAPWGCPCTSRGFTARPTTDDPQSTQGSSTPSASPS